MAEKKRTVTRIPGGGTIVNVRGGTPYDISSYAGRGLTFQQTKDHGARIEEIARELYAKAARSGQPTEVPEGKMWQRVIPESIRMRAAKKAVQELKKSEGYKKWKKERPDYAGNAGWDAEGNIVRAGDEGAIYDRSDARGDAAYMARRAAVSQKTLGRYEGYDDLDPTTWNAADRWNYGNRRFLATKAADNWNPTIEAHYGKKINPYSGATVDVKRFIDLAMQDPIRGGKNLDPSGLLFYSRDQSRRAGLVRVGRGGDPQATYGSIVGNGGYLEGWEDRIGGYTAPYRQEDAEAPQRASSLRAQAAPGMHPDLPVNEAQETTARTTLATPAPPTLTKPRTMRKPRINLRERQLAVNQRAGIR
jgi:hypothetical protein